MAERVDRDRERALLIEWAGGSRSAGEALLGLLLPGIHGLCLRILRHPQDAEEAAQETFARLCARVAKGGAVEDVRPWAATVAMNLCFDVRRRRGKESPVEFLEPQSSGPTAPLDASELDAIRKRLDELPERYQQVLHCAFALDLKPREIAKLLGMEDGAARVLLHRALQALRKKVTP